MTTATTHTRQNGKVFSTACSVRFVTARELRRLEADPVLDERDVWGSA
jgi:hypothetical protein